ncbi:YbaB/EbfC family nucleoid-associated protein [Candidatus Liberibacter africanus]|nr:YbaB/EbfC family nucleoid-associated protein [Candidatus Liberibacter africanus]QTP63913.1 YbaB/EbfC family nucleoid-associated protein [Candidatus Liberibacter africanus]
MMGQFKDIQGKIEEMKESIVLLEAEGNSGGGLISVRLNGKHMLTGVKIDSSLLCQENAEMLEDLIIAAHSDAHQKIEDLVAAKTQEITSGLPIPPGMKFPF